jgi:hypothetical protein
MCLRRKWAMTYLKSVAKGVKGGTGKAGGSKPNPNWPSKTGNPSGGDRGNNPPKK